MAIGPIQYTPMQDPFAGVGEAFQLGQQIRQARQQQLQQQQAQQRLQQYQADVEKYFQDPTATGAARLASLYPEQSKAFETGWKTLNAEQQQTELNDTQSVIAALANGRPEIANDLVTQRIEAMRASNKDASKLETIQKLIQEDPQKAKGYLQFVVAALPGGKDVIESIAKLGTERRAEELQPPTVAKTQAEAFKTQAEASKAGTEAQFAEREALSKLNERQWNVKNIQNQIKERGERLGLDRERLQLDSTVRLAELSNTLGKVDPSTKKEINDAIVSATTAKQSADQFNDLASRLEQANAYSGAAGSASEWLKKVGGFQDGITGLRQEYVRLRQGAVSKSLPPGPASDKDIQLALSGYPSDTSDPKLMASFLRGMGKLQDIQSSVDGAKAEWLGKNKGQLSRATETFIAGDYAVKPGETFVDFSKRVVKDVSQKYAPAQPAADRIPGSPNYVPPAQSSQEQSIRSQADAILGRK